jgi:hypothetical protein
MGEEREGAEAILSASIGRRPTKFPRKLWRSLSLSSLSLTVFKDFLNDFIYPQMLVQCQLNSPGTQGTFVFKAVPICGMVKMEDYTVQSTRLTNSYSRTP